MSLSPIPAIRSAFEETDYDKSTRKTDMFWIFKSSGISLSGITAKHLTFWTGIPHPNNYACNYILSPRIYDLFDIKNCKIIRKKNLIEQTFKIW